MPRMRLTSVTANCHVFDGRMNGRPLRLLLTFDDGRVLRLSVAADGYRMMVDDLPLEVPFEMGDYGGVIVADVTQSLDSGLSDAEVKGVRSLQLEGQQVGVQLLLAGGDAFDIWVDGD